MPSASGDPQPNYWQIDLTLVFDDASALAVLENGHESDTGFFFRTVDPRRDDAVAEAGRHPQLHAALTARPAHSELSCDRFC